MKTQILNIILYIKKIWRQLNTYIKFRDSPIFGIKTPKITINIFIKLFENSCCTHVCSNYKVAGPLVQLKVYFNVFHCNLLKFCQKIFKYFTFIDKCYWETWSKKITLNWLIKVAAIWKLGAAFGGIFVCIMNVKHL